MSECICGEINARNCPVHQGVSADKDKIEKAAEETFPCEMDTIGDWSDYENQMRQNAFKEGVAWRDANPSEDVLALVEALRRWLDWEQEQIKKEGNYVGEKINQLINEGRTALARWDARGK